MTTRARVDPRSRSRMPGPEEAELARRAAAGERAAFDALFDRYYARLTRLFDDLPRSEARRATRKALEQIFLGLDGGEDLAARAYRIARR